MTCVSVAPPYDPAVDVWINPPGVGVSTWTGRPLQRFADTEDPELVAGLQRIAASLPEPREDQMLLAKPALIADPFRRHLAQRLVDHAAARGLVLPITLWRWVEASRNQARGQASYALSGSALIIRITLQASVPLEDLPHLALHELQHAADMRAGTLEQLSIAEREERAMAFSLYAVEDFKP